LQRPLDVRQHACELRLVRILEYFLGGRTIGRNGRKGATAQPVVPAADATICAICGQRRSSMAAS
jgi:hypothetical protein